ncbi:MAG TPA: YegS/Rv2252/BmrU family lipid kinase [Bacteroidia bacterium]|jgi:diacylglycerol kinase (ATP)|nr:YegS/Rv2252/BmrU family lipid kinase [Bacteroidia bacterium]
MFVADGLRKKIAFIVNPNAGVSNTEAIVKQIREHTPAYVDYEIIFWETPAQGKEITDRVLNEKFTVAVAVGGDGTVNEVSKALVGTEVALAIIPIGSGNGLARHLKIPLDVKSAIHVILHGDAIRIDSCFINDKAFFCTSGIGFDAHIGKLFAETKVRGFSTYVRITIGQLLSYRASEYSLKMNKEEIKRKAFLITFANASQYGNDAFIAPLASVGDGLIDVCILKPFKFWDLPGIVWKMFHRSINSSHFMESYRASEIEVVRERKGPAHYDGEPDEMGEKLKIRIQPGSLSVIAPSA